MFDGSRRDLNNDKSTKPFREGTYGGTDVPESKRRDLGCVDPRYGAPGHSDRELEQDQHGQSKIGIPIAVLGNAHSKQNQRDELYCRPDEKSWSSAKSINVPARGRNAVSIRLRAIFGEIVDSQNRGKGSNPKSHLNESGGQTGGVAGQAYVLLQDDGDEEDDGVDTAELLKELDEKTQKQPSHGL